MLNKKINIIAIGAHADDIELGCGGTLAAAVRKGHRVKMIIMSEAQYSDYNGKVLRTIAQAKKEVPAAIKKLGVTDWEMLTFPNKDIPYNSSSVEALDKIFSKFKPDLILTHWTFDTHQDHHNTSLATISAARNYNNIFMYEPFPPSGRSYVAFRPQVYVDITETIKDKIDSIKAHQSQLYKYGNGWVESVKGRATMRGNECGVKHAEVFEPLRFMYDFKI